MSRIVLEILTVILVVVVAGILAGLFLTSAALGLLSAFVAFVILMLAIAQKLAEGISSIEVFGKIASLFFFAGGPICVIGWFTFFSRRTFII